MPSKSAEVAVAETTTMVEAIDQQDQQIAPYLGGETYNYDRLIEEIKFYNHQHLGSGFELGRRLIVLKATTEHGRFVPIMESLGITRKYGAGLMAFARTVVELSAASNGMLDFNKLKTMDYRKVTLLGELAQESPDELEATGTIGGRKLDEWDAKSRKELQAIVREQQGLLEKKTKALTDEKILRQKITDDRDAMLAGTSNSVSMAVTRLSERLREMTADFDQSAVLDGSRQLPSHNVIELVQLKAGLRAFHEQINNLIDSRYPEVLDAEVPPEIKLPGESILDEPPPMKNAKKPKVQDLH